MSNTDKAVAEKALNYSAKQVAAIVAASPMDFETAGKLGASFDPPKSARSVVSKIKSLGLEYITKPVPEKKPAKVTKAESVSAIESASEVDSGLFSGLEKATVASLVNLLNSLEYVD
jgi:hypothetical protein